MNKIGMICVVVSAMLVLSVANADVWDFAADFSATNNPNGAWQYGYQMATFNPYLADTTSYDGNTVAGWHYSGDWDTGGNMAMNLGPNAFEAWGSYREVNQLVLVTGLVELSGGRWIAPRDMTVDIHAVFTGQNPTGTTSTVQIFQGDTVSATALLNTQINGFAGRAVNNYTDAFGTNPTVTYDGRITVSAGDVILFGLSSGTAGGAPTGLELTFTEVPEPATLTLLVAGGLGCWLRRKK